MKDLSIRFLMICGLIATFAGLDILRIKQFAKSTQTSYEAVAIALPSPEDFTGDVGEALFLAIQEFRGKGWYRVSLNAPRLKVHATGLRDSRFAFSAAPNRISARVTFGSQQFEIDNFEPDGEPGIVGEGKAVLADNSYRVTKATARLILRRLRDARQQ